MKRFLLSAAALGLTAGMATADYTVTILHTNDFHARFEPISKYDGPCSVEDNTEGKCFGGSARLVSAIAEARGRTRSMRSRPEHRRPIAGRRTASAR